MKNNYLIAFLAASMALAGCSKSEVIGSEEPIARHSIGFSTYANESKALPITGNTGGTNNFQMDGNAFGVTAFFNVVEEPYMGAAALGTQIQYTTTPTAAWGYVSGEIYFWPATTGSTDKLRFYAYAPFTSANTTAPVAPTFSNTATTQEMKFTNYTVPADVTKQDDFMYTTAEAIVLSTGNQSVLLAFAHALTQIHFAARTQATNLKVEIAVNGIQVCNIGSVGTFTLTPASTPSAAWLDTKTLTNYTIPSTATLPATPIGYSTTDYTAIDNATANVLMLIPQTTTAWVP
ncbi:MAG: fimbrillin family protein, partial [Mucinivorans sp.]